MPTTYPYAPAATNADEDAYAAPTCADPVDITSHDELIASAKFVFGPAFDELMGLLKGRVSSQAYRQTFTCGASLAVGDAVEIAGDLAVQAVTTGRPFGWVRYKPTTTTCYLDHFKAVTGLSGVAGQPYQIAGQTVGFFISSTIALCFASAPSGVSFSTLDDYTATGVSLAWLNGPSAMVHAYNNFI